MNISKYPEFKPGRKRIKRFYVAIMMWIVGKAIQVAATIDKDVKNEFAKLPTDFRLRLLVLPEKSFPLFFYAKALPAFVADKGLLPFGMQMIIGKDKAGKVRYLGADPKGRKIDLDLGLKSLEAAMLVFTFRESTTTAYAHDRFVVSGNLPYATGFMRVLDIVEVYLLPKVIAGLAVKRYPKWSEMSPLRKHINRIIIYGRAFTF